MKSVYSSAVVRWLVATSILPAASISMAWAQSEAGDLRSFTNAATITIVDETQAVPYPSVILVSGLTGIVTNLSVTLRALTHSYPDDIDILLVGPDLRRAMLMSDAGGSFPVNGVTFTFDSVGRQIPNSTQITSGVYSTANWGGSTGDSFPAPAPAGPHLASLESFDGGDPNGMWALYIMDDIPGNDGELADGWSLTIATGPESAPTLTVLKSSLVVQLSWPTNSPGYALEARLDLQPPSSWAAVTNAATITNDQYQVVVPADEPRRFFRLRK